MANIEKRGKAYRIVVSAGYDTNDKQIKYSMTYKPEEGMTLSQIKKELKKIEVEFEEKCALGYSLNSNIKLIDFIEIWFKDYVGNKNLSPVTVEGYKRLSIKVVQELGHVQIGKITPKQVQDFYTKLKYSNGVRGGEKFKVTEKYIEIISGLKQKDISCKASINDDTLRKLKNGGHTTLVTAKKISNALSYPFKELFLSTNEKKPLSNTSVLHYHKFINNVFNTAVRWGVIPFNTIEKRVELPKIEKEEASYLDNNEALILLNLLEEEPIKYRTAINLLIFSGLRRGELCGLKWCDIDFEGNIITINRSLKYISGQKAFEGVPKTRGSLRSIKLPQSIFKMLKEYHIWQLKERLKIGDQWHDHDYVFCSWNGEPINLDTFGKYLKKLTTKHKLKDIHLHSLRHTNATILIASGVNLKTVSSRLGHSDLSTTGDIYTHAIQAMDAKASNALENMLLIPQAK